MKILFSAPGYPSKDYPFASFIGAMAEELARRGNDVTVIAPQSITHGILRNGKVLPKLQVIESLNFNTSIRIYRPYAITLGDGVLRGRLTLLALQSATLRLLKKIHQQFDVIYCHFWQSAYQVLPYALKMNIPMVVVSGEDKIKLTSYLSAAEIESLKLSTRTTIAVSTKNRNECISLNLSSPDNTIVIPNGPDLRVFHKFDKRECRARLKFSNDDFIVCFVGRFIHRKGALRVEKAIRSLNDPSIKAIFIGSTMKDEDKSQEPQGDEIIFKGVVPHDHVPQYLSSADVYVLPTLAEGCSNSIVEAMACGLPVISSRMDFNFDILDETNSIMVDPLNVEEIAQAISKLVNDSTLRRDMSESSLRKASDLNFIAKVNKIEKILKNLTV